jgi:glycosyltransferase involved in cell wall biosynthesis
MPASDTSPVVKMATSGSPLVSVVIPVYNGQDTIADAIRSVLAQTYKTFNLTIANNCSTDGTAAIAEEFARNDPRVRVYHATEFVSVVDSHNRAFTLISDDAEYCKILMADDWLFPTCLAELVAVAEAYPSVGMVSSYMLRENRVVFDGLPYGGSFWKGREAARRYLLEGIDSFGGPSASLIRASVVRAKRPFCNPRIYHGDTDAYLDIMQRHDFGFVYQVLSFQRRDQQAATTPYLERVTARPAEVVDLVTRFGPVYLSPIEYKKRLRRLEHLYYKMLARSLFESRGEEFWDFHERLATDLGHGIDHARLRKYVSLHVVDKALNPLNTFLPLAKRVFSRAKGAGSHATAPAPVKALTR